MPTLHDLPVELILRILKGAPLKDVLSVTNISAFFRAIGDSTIIVWKNAQDVHRLPFPMGETLQTTSVESLPKLAARATATSSTWDSCITLPRRFKKVSMDFCGSLSVHRKPRISVGSRRPLIAVTLLPGNRWILFKIDNRLYIYCLENDKSLALDCSGDVISYACESPDNGASVTIATLVAVDHVRDDMFLDVYCLNFDRSTHCRELPGVTRAQSIRLPSFSFVDNVRLKDSLAILSGANHVLIANWKEASGLRLSSPEEPEEAADFDLWVHCHPSRALLLGEKLENDEKTSYHLIDLPQELPVFTGPDLRDPNLEWPTEKLVTIPIHNSDIPSDDLQIYKGFRSKTTANQQDPLFDIIICREDQPPPDLTKMSFSGFEESSIASHVIAHDDILGCQGLEAEGFVQVNTACGHTLCVGVYSGTTAVSDTTVSFLRFPDSTIKEPCWVRLKLPVQLRNGAVEVHAFDDIYGTMVLGCGVDVYIVQY